MKTILIPVDFSETSANAIHYAAYLSCDANVDRIILLKSFYKSVYAELLPTPDLVQLTDDDIDNERQQIAGMLNNLSTGLSKKCHSKIKVETIISNLPLLRAIHQTIADEKPDVLVIGSDGTSSETYIGRHIISIAKSSPVPVLVVPAHVKYKTIKHAIVPADLDALSRLQVFSILRASNNWPQPKLTVLSVDANQKHTHTNTEHTKAISSMLSGYHHSISYSAERNIVQAVLNFADAEQAQIIIALPGKHSFFYNLTHSSITAALSQNAKKPVLILK